VLGAVVRRAFVWASFSHGSRAEFAGKLGNMGVETGKHQDIKHNMMLLGQPYIRTALQTDMTFLGGSFEIQCLAIF